jgi:uncharacterized protein RhaS with RHS repeats
LHDNFYRAYDPATGRYLEADPIGQAGGINVYTYARDNPVRWTDPDGLLATAHEFLLYPPGPGATSIIPSFACGQRVARRVLAESKGIGLPGTGFDNTPWNAYLHCLWSCEMVKECGFTTSLVGGFGHEIWDDGKVPYFKDYTASSKDVNNNAHGRDCGRIGDCGSGHEHRSCSECCLHKLASGHLRY